MKSLIVLAPSYYPNNGGVEKHLEKVCEGLIKQGWKVTVLVRYAQNYPKALKHNGVEIMRMPSLDGSKTLWLWYLKSKKMFDEATAIHSHDYFPFALRKLIKNKRWVHTFHGYEGYPLDTRAITSRQQVAKAVDYAFCVGGFIEKWYGTKCDEVLYGAVDQNVKFPATYKKIKWDFSFVGRFEPDTGIKEYLKAFKKDLEKDPSLTFVAVGDGSLMDWAKNYCIKNHLPVDFVGKVKDPNKYLLQSKVALVSGYLAILEAAFLKKPIIAYYGTPIKQDYLQMHPIASDMYVTSTTDEIIRASQQALKPNMIKIKKAHSWAKTQSWSAIIKKYVAYY